MKNYIVTEKQTFIDAQTGNRTTAILNWVYPSGEDDQCPPEADSKYFSLLAVAALSPVMKHTVEITTEDGNLWMSRSYNREQPPVPVNEETEPTEEQQEGEPVETEPPEGELTGTEGE